MRVTLFTFMLCLIVCTAESQVSLQPTRIINQLKIEGKTFSAYQPFSPATQTRSSNLSSYCKDCAVMALDKTSLQRMNAKKAEQLSLQLPGNTGKNVELELYQVNPFAGGFQVETSDGSVLEIDESTGIHYRGVIKGESQSLAAVSIYEDEIMMLMSSPRMGNLVVGQMEDQSGNYVMYTAESLDDRHAFDCATTDSYQTYRPEELRPQTNLRSSSPCVKIYLEIDNDVVSDKGGVDPTVNFIAGIFNEVAALYANENIKVELSKLFLWTGPSPYNANNSFDMLRQFQGTRTSFEGDLAQLISYKASGGIAIVDGLCQSRAQFKMSFSSISRSFRTVPTYSYTVMVVAHELGHLMGSQHTHACVWNGNGTALDGCAGFTEGNCALPDLPSDGGSIMSYCHITRSGINFAKGFGPQPGNLIRNRVNGASCLQVCNTDNGDNGDNGNNGDNQDGCTDVTFELVLDLFGTETSWEIRDLQGNLIGSGSGYKNKKEGEIISENFCLAEGCYTLKVSDTEGDGLCCQYGDGSFQVADASGNVLVSGAQFEFESVQEFCVSGEGDDNDDNDNDDSECVSIDFNKNKLDKYGGSQDQGTATLTDGGKGAVLTGNAWKAINLPYEVTSETVLRFEFRSTKRPEIAGIGFDTDQSLSSSQTFILYGSQSWGIRNFKNYPGNGEWKTYEIPVGTFYTGAMEYLFFAADHDRSPKDGNAQFRNIFIYETNPCNNIPSTFPGQFSNTPAEKGINVFPNPSNKEVFFEIKDPQIKSGTIEVYNMYGQQIKSALIEDSGVIKIMTNDLPNGTYLYRLSGFESEYTGKFSVHR